MPRMREYIQAVRAVWAAWQGEGTLRFDGDHYRLSLMTPFFNPGPIDHPDIPVVIAAVNPAMCRLAGELCQGLVVHPFHTVDYLDQVVKPAVAAGAERTGRSADAISLHAAVMVVTGRDGAEMEAAAAQARQADRLLRLDSLLPAGRGACRLGCRARAVEPRQTGALGRDGGPDRRRDARPGCGRRPDRGGRRGNPPPIWRPACPAQLLRTGRRAVGDRRRLLGPAHFGDPGVIGPGRKGSVTSASSPPARCPTSL